MDENCVNRNNEQETTSKGETWSRGAIDVNVKRNLSIDDFLERQK